jgi:hypothetical protein
MQKGLLGVLTRSAVDAAALRLAVKLVARRVSERLEEEESVAS